MLFLKVESVVEFNEIPVLGLKIVLYSYLADHNYKWLALYKKE